MSRAPFGLALLATGCSVLLDIHDVPDAAIASDAADAGVVWSSLDDATKWSTFDLAAHVDVRAVGFIGGAFDGRFVHFVPNNVNKFPSGFAVAYDTTAAFATASSWTTFDVALADARLIGMKGAAFDGRYVYEAPYYDTALDGVVARYDTEAPLTATSSWSAFDAATVNPAAQGFESAVFDGRFVYFVPYKNAGGLDGVVTRFDTLGAFSSAQSWSTFDATAIDAHALAFHGAIFDGRYVYFAPNLYGFVLRYDTTSPFATAASWSTFDMTTVRAGTAGMWGGVFDGRYVYFTPNNDGAVFGVVARYDTEGAFDAKASWSTFDLATKDAGAKGFRGGAFDGRFVYFVPNDGGAILARYDTTSSSFGALDAWSTFDVSRIDAAATGFEGAVFDGRFLHLVPTFGGVVARFDARSTSALPPGFPHGSFF
jgi:hypothetical protein